MPATISGTLSVYVPPGTYQGDAEWRTVDVGLESLGLRENDVVLVLHHTRIQFSIYPELWVYGWETLAAGGGAGVRTVLSGKRMGAAPDMELTACGRYFENMPCLTMVYVLRGIDPSAELGAVVAQAEGDEGPPNPPSVPVGVCGSVVVVIACGEPSIAALDTIEAPEGYGYLLERREYFFASGSICSAISAKRGYRDEIPSEFGWPVYGNAAWVSFTLVLPPAVAESCPQEAGDGVADDDIASWPLPDLYDRATDRSGFGFTPYRDQVESIGHVSSSSLLSVLLWAGGVDEVELLAVASYQTAGILTDGLPSTILPRTSERVDMAITADGLPLFEGAFDLASDCLVGDTIRLVVIGSRLPVSNVFWPHNWESGLDESFTWKTDVLIAHDRTEQRIRLRTNPRRSWDVRLLVSADQRRRLEAIMGLRTVRSLLAPLWQQAVPLPTPIIKGYAVIGAAVSGADWMPGEPVAVWSTPENVEIHTIDSVLEDRITTILPFADDWPADGQTLIAPCRYCLPLGGRSVNRFTEDVGDFKISLTAIHDQWQPTGPAPETYRDVPVCPFVPSWEGGTESWDNKWLALDNDTGLIEYDIQSVEPIFTRDARFLVVGPENIATFLAFLSVRAGRLAPFWLAATDRSLELAENSDSGSSAIVVTSSGYTEILAGSPARSHIEMITLDGLTLRRMITGAVVLEDGTERLSLDAPLPVDLSSSSLERCAWLELVRLNNDEVNVHWITAECLEVTLPIVVLP